MTSPSLTVVLAEDQLQELAVRIAGSLSVPESQVWLGTQAAAAHLGCSQHRIRDLVKQRRVQFAKEGGRLVFRREWLDALVTMEDVR